MNLDIATPKWALPLLQPSRYKGAKGGRSSGKSHFFAERVVECHIADPDFSTVCIREIQRSLKFSMKRLIEKKIYAMGVAHLFQINNDAIYRKDGTGVILFEGMQDHTADSIKSLEDFDLALVEEAQNLSQRSLDLLLPTIRKEGSEVWFIWNPDQATDPVDQFLVANCPDNAIVVHVNFLDNPFCPQVTKDEAANWLKRDPDGYRHIWLGEYNTKSDDQVLHGCWRVDEFTPGDDWDGPYLGADWGFSSDPGTLLEAYIHDKRLYVYREELEHAVEVVDIPDFFDRIPNAKTHTVRGDSARPEIISHMNKHGYPKVVSVEKWPGSVEDGISHLRGYDEIVIHVQCTNTITEANMWKYKRDRLTGDVLTKLISGNDHCWDAVRYALAPLIKRPPMATAW